MKARGLRRGGTLALVLCLFLALGAVLLGVLTMAAAATGASEREYRRSQALALAEAGVAEALAGRPPHGEQPLGPGSYSWSAEGGEESRRVTARGRVASVSGASVTRTVRARLARRSDRWQVRAWEESP
jgi:hypothetical protein